MRTVVVGTSGWPFLVKYWLNDFQEWKGLIDKVVFSLGGWVEESTKDYVRELIAKEPKAVLYEELEPWPKSLELSTQKTEGDLLFMHDDCFTLPTAVKHYFKLAEQGLVVTPIECTYSPIQEVRTMLLEKYPNQLPWRVNTKEEFSFLMYFFFISRFNFNRTRKNLGSHSDINWNGDAGFEMALDLLDAKIPVFAVDRGFQHIQSLSYQVATINNFNKADDLAKSGLVNRKSWLNTLVNCDPFDEIPEYRDKVKKVVESL